MSESYFRHFSRLAGALVVLLGGLVLLGWAEHWVFLVQILPGTAPMKCNTALGFIFGGASLVLLTTRRSHLAAWLGLFPAAIGVLTLMEYLTGENFSIDELFVRDYILTATAYPGRMSPLGAVCFSCLGLGLVVVGMKSRGRQWRLTVTGLLACVAAVIAFVVLFGYVFGIQSAYGWGAYTRMAMPTAMAFLLLSLGLLVWAWRRAVAEQFNFLRWLPVTASLSLMAMIGFVSYSSLNQLKSSTDLSKHSSDVLDTSQSLLTDIFATQRGMRNYVLTGQDAALLIFQEGATNTPRLLARMIVQVADNPGQQQRVMSMASSLNGLLDYSRRLIDTRREQGINAGIQMESDGQGFMFIRHTLEELQAFTDEEHRLLDERTLAADADFHNTTFLMLMGSALAGVLLVIANFMASREIRIRQQIQETLRQSEEKFSKAFQSSPIAMSIVEADSGRYIEVNEGFCRLYGFTLSEVIGRTSLDLGIWKSPEERERQLMSRLRADGTVRNLELTRTIRTGETRVVLINSDRVDLDGKQCIVALLQDITERKRAEAALRESEERFRRSFEDAPIGLALVSLQGRWLRVNRALCDMIGRGEEELLATDFQAITHPDDLQTDLGLVQQLLDGKLRDYKMEKRYFHKQGQVVYVLLSVSLVRGPDGSPLYFVSQIQDITERKQAELKLLEQSEALRRSNQELEQFAYVASHDMQEPLRAVAGFTQILKANYQGKLDTRADSFITHIVDGAKRMADIIDDLLKLSRVGLQGKPYVKTGIEIPLALAMENLTVAIKEKQAVVSHGPLPALPIDASQLSLVFQNLIGNAMKFCRDRPPEIRVGAARLGDGTWEISVRDNGIGIEPKYFNRLFGIFQRLHTRDEYPGTGIGLAICKKVVERHGGKIWLDSLPGKGTTFYFTLPENQKLKS